MIAHARIVASTTGINALTVAGIELEAGSYRRNAAPARVGEDGKAIEGFRLAEAEQAKQQAGESLPENASTQELIEAIVQQMEDGMLGIRTDSSAIEIQVNNPSIGSGNLGSQSGSVTLSESVEFNITGTLGTELRLGSNAIMADKLDITDLGGQPLAATSAGIKGLEVGVSLPLSTERTVSLSVGEGRITSLRWGTPDTTQSKDE